MSITVYDLERTVNSDITTSVKISKINFGQLFIEIDIEALYSTILYLKTNEQTRKESRGSHYRSDYPEKEKNLTFYNIYCSWNQKPQRSPVLMTRMKPDASAPM
jgi:succinate dehydrogenase/fumarate reductase flavoprotein subunit